MQVDWATQEAELLEAGRQGDCQSFARVYSYYRPRLVTQCAQVLRDRAEAEDVVQDAFLRAWSHIGTFDPSKPVWPWLLTIAQRLCIDRWRASTDRGRHKPRVSLHDVTASSQDGDFTEQISLRVRLTDALSEMTPRYRRLLVLHAVDGWSYVDLARAEGSTVTSVGKVLNRARSRARDLLDPTGTGHLVALSPVFVLARIVGEWRRRSRAVIDRASVLVTGARARTASCYYFLDAGVQALTAGGLALALLFVGGGLPLSQPPATPVAALGATPTSEGTQSHATLGSLVSVSGTAGGLLRSAGAPPASGLDALKHAFDPGADRTPETTRFYSIAISPSFAKDQTIVASGGCLESYDCGMIFVSRDAGRTWTETSHGYVGAEAVYLPPAFPADNRIFIMTREGLQESDNGGLDFVPVEPIEGVATISPGFDNGDPRLLIGAETVYAYRYDVHMPVPLQEVPVVAGAYKSIALAPDFPSSHLMLLSGNEADSSAEALVASNGDLRQIPFYKRCDPLCHTIDVAGFDAIALGIRLSSHFARDGVAYMFSGTQLVMSDDGGLTFQARSFPTGIDPITDLVVSPSDPSRLYASAGLLGQASRGLFESTDGGRTWRTLDVDLPDFKDGTSHVALTPSGMLLVTGVGQGIAYSNDDGATWTMSTSADQPDSRLFEVARTGRKVSS